MCDFILDFLATRPARVGDKLALNSITRSRVVLPLSDDQGQRCACYLVRGKFKGEGAKMPFAQQEATKASADQPTSNELVRLIRKLRWMGMENEAEPLIEELMRRRAVVSIITPFLETD